MKMHNQILPFDREVKERERRENPLHVTSLCLILLHYGKAAWEGCILSVKIASMVTEGFPNSRVFLKRSLNLVGL